jgi:ATP-dependent Clp protease adaptor protein ClpS
MSNHKNDVNFDNEMDGELLSKARKSVAKPPLYKVFLLNDDYTTMEFVVEVLEVIFKHNHIQATVVMLDIHNNGKGVAGTYTREIAETKIAQVHAAAKRSGFPLKCRMEQA